MVLLWVSVVLICCAYGFSIVSRISLTKKYTSVKSEAETFKRMYELAQNQKAYAEYQYELSQQNYYEERDKRLLMESEQNSWGCRKGVWCESCCFARELESGEFLCIYGRCHNHILREIK